MPVEEIVAFIEAPPAQTVTGEDCDGHAGEAVLVPPAPVTTVPRFTLSERQIHWSIAIPFTLCFVTAVVLVVVYNPNPLRPLRALVSWVHRLSGACLATLPLIAALRGRQDFRLHLANVREACRWTRDELLWLVLMVPAAIDSRVKLPDQGKFNAAEKMNFLMVTGTCPLFILSGVLFWSDAFPFVAWVVHFALAAIATPLMLGHIFMATVNPSTRVGLSGMVTGHVDRHWARHHYARWYREEFEADAPEPVAIAPAPARPTVEGVPVADAAHRGNGAHPDRTVEPARSEAVTA